MIKKELMEILACPDCKGDVQEKENKIICKNCGKKYPIRDGIPVMLVEEAEGGHVEETTISCGFVYVDNSDCCKGGYFSPKYLFI